MRKIGCGGCSRPLALGPPRQASLWLHAGQAGQARAAQEVHQDGLGLVVLGVGHGHGRGAHALGNGGEKIVSRGAGRGFDGARLGGQKARRQPMEVKRQPALFGLLAHEIGLGGKLGAQGMIEVGHVQREALFGRQAR